MTIVKVDPEKVKDNPYQPRAHYPTKTIGEIAYSIEQIGIIHPPTGRQVDGHYELAEGHLRKRAFIKLKKKNPKKFAEMPLDVREISNQDMAIIALEENLRRHDITPLDQARAVDTYLTNFKDSTETALAKTLNMTQGNISNMRRVLKCPDDVLQKIVDGKINFTMARELLVFQGLNLGKKRYSYGRGGDKDRDERWLMLEAIRGVGGTYGPPATVDGIKKAIYSVCSDNMKHLDKGGGYYGRDSDPLFDTRLAGCLKCAKMIRANETKTQIRHFCSDDACWDKKQNAHKKKMAAEAVRKRDAELSQRLKDTEAHNAVLEEVTGEKPASVEFPDETTAIIPVLDTAEEILEEQKEKSYEESVAEAPKFKEMDDVCVGCLNQKECGRRSRVASDDAGYYCLDRVTKDNYHQIREKAKAVVPDSLKSVVKDHAGTRAEVIDIREIRLGTYGTELKGGFALLDAHVYDGWRDSAQTILDRIDDPDECLTRCTKGFHYAYDSSDHEAKVRYVCSDPKCLAKKKAAYTRGLNAKGQNKKKAEMKAIRQAVEQTETIDKPRLLLIIEAQLQGSHVSRGYNADHIDWFAKHLKIEKEDPGGNKQAKVLKKLPSLSEEELRKLIVEFCLITLCYDGDIQGYKIQTTEKLNRMGIGIQIEKKSKEAAK